MKQTASILILPFDFCFSKAKHDEGHIGINVNFVVNEVIVAQIFVSLMITHEPRDENLPFAYAETKAQITAHLINAFVFASQTVQFLYLPSF